MGDQGFMAASLCALEGVCFLANIILYGAYVFRTSVRLPQVGILEACVGAAILIGIGIVPMRIYVRRNDALKSGENITKRYMDISSTEEAVVFLFSLCNVLIFVFHRAILFGRW